mmetsp:Transcript_54012/g.80208  ORF Transcript_54012/g.80208 Transcript_54012/m.80208 type:complete len:138 (+) Transcript_54012:41-454(+)
MGQSKFIRKFRSELSESKEIESTANSAISDDSFESCSGHYSFKMVVLCRLQRLDLRSVCHSVRRWVRLRDDMLVPCSAVRSLWARDDVLVSCSVRRWVQLRDDMLVSCLAVGSLWAKDDMLVSCSVPRWVLRLFRGP